MGTKEKGLFSPRRFIFLPYLGADDISDDPAVLFQHEGQIGDKAGMELHDVNVIMPICPRLIDIPKSSSSQFRYCSVVLFCLQTYCQILHSAKAS